MQTIKLRVDILTQAVHVFTPLSALLIHIRAQLTHLGPDGTLTFL